MEQTRSIFSIFGGVCPMARKLGEKPSNVMAWKRNGRIPAEKQPHVLETALALDLPVTAENIVYPLGHGAALAEQAGIVLCDRAAKLQRRRAA